MTVCRAKQLFHRRCKYNWPLLFIFFVLFFSLPLQASAAEKKRQLLIGIEPEHNIFDQVQRYRVLSGYLSDQLNMEVKLTIMSRYGEVVKRFKSRRLDGALLSSYTAHLAISELDLIPVASPVKSDGGVSSRGYLFVRKDSGIKNIEDMRGKRVVFVDRSTTEGYLYARSYFQAHGIADMDAYFSRHYFSGSHASAVFAVLDGRADIGSAKDTVYNKLIQKDPSIREELSIVAQSPSVPEVTLCISKVLGPKLLERLQATLLNMEHTAEGHRVLKELAADRFVVSDPDDFSVVSEMTGGSGSDMSKGGGN